MQAKENKKLIRCFPSADRCSAISRKTGLHHTLRSLGKTDVITPNVPSSSFIPHVLLLSKTPYDVGHPFGQLGSAVPAVSPPSFFCTTTWSLVVWWEEEKRPLPRVSTAHQGLKYPCAIINTVLVTKAKNSPVQATMKKIKSIPAKNSILI